MRQLVVTESAWERTVGLLGHSGLAPDAGLLILGCASIHTFFMRFAIDAVFLDETMRICKVVENLVPWRAARGRGARHVLELPAGTAARLGLHSGITTRIEEPTPEANHDR